MNTRFSKWIFVALAPLLTACHGSSMRAPAPQPVAAMTQGDRSPNSLDAVNNAPLVFEVQIFIVSVPQNTFSGNEAFWKRIDEQCFDPGTSDLLQKNGIRAGVAASDELTHLNKFLDGVMPVQKFTTTAMEVKNMEVEMKANLPEQTIFHFDKANTPIGRTYAESSNVMNVSFAPTPHKPGRLRLTLCPMIRTLRQRLEISQVDDQYQFIYTNPESNYDLNFTVDIPNDGFLIVTPSTDAYRKTSVGHAFFLKTIPTEEQEQMLLIVPTPLDTAKSAKRTK